MKKILFFSAAFLIAKVASAALVWNGKCELWTSGKGTQAEPYMLEKPQHLAYLSQQVANGSEMYEDVWFMQIEDFDMGGDIGWMFTPIGTDNSHPFKGHFDGNGRTISNIQITYANNIQYCALFGYAIGSTIQNITIESISFAASDISHVAALVAYLENGSVRNCTNNSDFAANANCVAGLVAVAGKCDFNNCMNRGTITASNISYLGGLIGSASSSTINNCVNEGSIISTTDNGINYVGGVCGEGTSLNIATSHNKGDIQYTCTNPKEYYSFSGYGTSIFYYYYSYIGGLVGGSSASSEPTIIASCAYNEGNISLYSAAPTFYCGGLCGESGSESSFTRCYNIGSITSSKGTMYIAGLSFGYGTFTECYNRGSIIKATESCGLAKSGTLISCYAVCNLLNGTYNYGIAKNGTIKHCYYAGSMSGSYRYAIAQSCTYENNYYLAGNYAGKSSESNPNGTLFGQSLSMALMKAVSFPMSLNHNEDEVFIMDENNINDGYPILVWQLEGVSKFTVTLSCDEAFGFVSGAGTYDKDEIITISATANEGYAFDCWSDGSTANPREIIMDSNKNLTANFVKMVYTIDINQNCTITIE